MVLVWTVVVVLVIFLIRLLTVQIFDQKYHELAQQNAIRRVNAYAPRGIVFDRNGKKIVVNRPIYDLMVGLETTQSHNIFTISPLLVACPNSGRRFCSDSRGFA
jgi:penicillin-binding protein 2